MGAKLGPLALKNRMMDILVLCLYRHACKQGTLLLDEIDGRYHHPGPLRDPCIVNLPSGSISNLPGPPSSVRISG